MRKLNKMNQEKIDQGLNQENSEETKIVNKNPQIEMTTDRDAFKINELEKLEQNGFRSKIVQKTEEKHEKLPEKFKEILLEKEIKEFKSDLPYIVGYKGFRRGVKSGNYYGKNFNDTSISAKKDILNK